MKILGMLMVEGCWVGPINPPLYYLLVHLSMGACAPLTMTLNGLYCADVPLSNYSLH